MKTLNHFLIFLIFLLLGCQTNKKTTISGELIGYKQSNPLLYTVSNPNWLDLSDTIYPNKNGLFYIELDIDKPYIFSLNCRQDSGSYYLPRLLIKPGENHTVKLHTIKNFREKSLPILTGPNSDGQYILNSIDEGIRWVVGYYPLKNEWNLSQPGTLVDSFNAKVDRAYLPLQKLYSIKKIDKTFLAYSKNYIDYYYAYHLAMVVEEALGDKKTFPDSTEYEKIDDYLFNKFPNKNSEILNSSVLIDYLFLYNNYFTRRNHKEYQSYASKGLALTYQLKSVKNALSPEAYKYYAISTIWSNSGQKNRECIDLFNQYKKEFSGYENIRPYQRLEKVEIPKLLKFFAQDSQVPESISFIDEDKTISSLDDLISIFKGHPVLIDCWATWCGPCLSQFRFAEPLETFLKKNKIELLYIAFEKNIDREKVKLVVKNNNLFGHHLISNIELDKDFKTRFGNEQGFTLPKYILINAKGQVVNNNTLFPSDQEKLYFQIAQDLK